MKKKRSRAPVGIQSAEAIASLELAHPDVDESKLEELAAAKRKLLSK
jgi:hypothetical protein